jgi:hypothetical protein
MRASLLSGNCFRLFIAEWTRSISPTPELLTQAADSSAGSAVITIGADQSTAFEDVSKLVLQHQASDFHLL